MKRSKLGRALRVLGLWLGFDTLGLGLSAVLFALPVMQVRYEQLGFSGMLACVLGLWMLIALIPRPQRYVEPGSALEPGAHPRLQALIADVAARAGQPVPRRLYLVHEASAFTARVPKWFGLASDPIVGIGLPLFELLDEKQLEAVLAHEFGHHWGGDVRLGPWVRRTHHAIAQALDRFDGASLWLHLPFVVYGNFFMRTAHQASREQELTADALAAKLCGPHAIAGALRRIDAGGVLWQLYFRDEVIPVMERKRIPPLWSGFHVFREQFARRPEWLAGVARDAVRKTSELDTHPVLADRLAAIGLDAEDRAIGADGAGCWSLLTSQQAAEQHVLADLLVSGDPRALAPISWDEVGAQIWLPHWREQLSGFPALARLRIEQLPEVLAPNSDWTDRLRTGLALLSPAAQRKQLVQLLTHWLSVALCDAGFQIDAKPGATVRLSRAQLELEPERLVQDLASGKTGAADWVRQCALIERARAGG